MGVGVAEGGGVGVTVGGSVGTLVGAVVGTVVGVALGEDEGRDTDVKVLDGVGVADLEEGTLGLPVSSGA